MKNQYDVIVVGGGGAGMSAALLASETRARVLLIDAADRLGGSTAQSGGVFYAAGTSVQRAMGIEDSPANAYRQYMLLNQYKVEPILARKLLDDSAAALEWLMELGVSFRGEHLYDSGIDGVARGHRAAEGGAEIGAMLGAAISRKPIDVALRTRARKLICDAAGRVRGINADGVDVRAGAVVLASGGFGANPEMLTRYYPEAAAHNDWAWYIGIKECRGDAIDMARDVGADIVGYNRGLLNLAAGFTRQVEPYFPGWVMCVNRDGRRFMNETLAYVVASEVVRVQLGSECFGLLDEDSRLAAKSPPSTPLNRWGSTWETERLAQYAKERRVYQADTIDELAESAGIHAPALKTTLERYNADCAAGEDSAFSKAKDLLRPIRTPPFYAARMRACQIALTSCGPKIDPDAQVLRRDDLPIPGLYAAGEVSGGVLGDRYVGGGNSICNAIVFGRIAGRNAAAFALKNNG